jgi:hypothetical protein
LEQGLRWILLLLFANLYFRTAAILCVCFFNPLSVYPADFHTATSFSTFGMEI